MYLPPNIVEDATIPLPLGKDFWFQVRLAAQKWKRGFFPTITYRPISKQPTMQPDAPEVASGAVPVGEPGTTAFDPLYGEAVDPKMITDGAWRQPHLSADLQPADPEVYLPDVSFRARVQVETQDSDLHPWGFEENLGVVVTVPASILDEVGVTAQRGDLLQWGGKWYEVVQVGPPNRWLNTTTALYVALNCQTKRRGS